MDMQLAIAPGLTIHWLFKSHDLPSKFGTIASRMCDTNKRYDTNKRNREMKHNVCNPVVENIFVFTCSSCA